MFRATAQIKLYIPTTVLQLDTGIHHHVVNFLHLSALFGRLHGYIQQGKYCTFMIWLAIIVLSLLNTSLKKADKALIINL